MVRKAALHGPKSVEEDRKNFRKTAAYIHLTLKERRELLRQIAETVRGWDDCYLFAECTDKTTFGGSPPRIPPFEEAFTQVVTRFHRFLQDQAAQEHGLLVQDDNETMARRLILEPEPEGGYAVWVPVLPGCVSQGETREEALANIREAIQCYLESCQKHGEPIPEESAMEEATVEVAM